MSGTFAFAISRLRTERPSLRPWHHISSYLLLRFISAKPYEQYRLFINLTLLLYQIFFDFSNEGFFWLANGFQKANLNLSRYQLSKSLSPVYSYSRVIWQVSCLPKRARLTPYIQPYFFYSLRIDYWWRNGDLNPRLPTWEAGLLNLLEDFAIKVMASRTTIDLRNDNLPNFCSATVALAQSANSHLLIRRVFKFFP